MKKKEREEGRRGKNRKRTLLFELFPSAPFFSPLLLCSFSERGTSTAPSLSLLWTGKTCKLNYSRNGKQKKKKKKTRALQGWKKNEVGGRLQQASLLLPWTFFFLLLLFLFSFIPLPSVLKWPPQPSERDPRRSRPAAASRFRRWQPGRGPPLGSFFQRKEENNGDGIGDDAKKPRARSHPRPSSPLPSYASLSTPGQPHERRLRRAQSRAGNARPS